MFVGVFMRTALPLVRAKRTGCQWMLRKRRGVQVGRCDRKVEEEAASLFEEDALPARALWSTTCVCGGARARWSTHTVYPGRSSPADEAAA